MNAQEQATANIAACNEALKAFEPIATPELMRDLRAAVDRHEAVVRKANGLEPFDEADKPGEYAPRLLNDADVDWLLRRTKRNAEEMERPEDANPDHLNGICHGVDVANSVYAFRIASGELITKEEHEITLHNAVLEAENEATIRALDDKSGTV